MRIKVINRNMYCMGISVQYSVNGENVLVTFGSDGVAEIEEEHFEALQPHGIEMYEEGMGAFDITSATNEQLFDFLSSRNEEYLAGLANEAELPSHEWENKRKNSLAVYLYEKLKKPESEGEIEPNATEEGKGRGRPKKQN